MPHMYADRVRESVSTSGTADFTLSGAITGGFVTFSSVLANNDTVHYCAINTGASEFEVGFGTYNAGVLARTTVLANHLGTTNKVSFTNSPQVFIDMPAGQTALTRKTGISAAGTVQGDATQLTHNYNDVTTVASGAGVILKAGMPTWIRNRGLNALKVYPNSGAAINALSADVADTLPVGTPVHIVPMTTALWITF